MGPLPITESGPKYILVVGDSFTKWTELFPLPNEGRVKDSRGKAGGRGYFQVRGT